MAETIVAIRAVLYYTSLPLAKLLHGLAIIVSPFLAVVHFLFLPITYLVHAILGIVLLPFKVQLLEKIETIYVFLSIAGLIGCLTGAILHLLFNFLSSNFNIDAAAESRAPEQGRSLAAYRVDRRKKKKKVESPGHSSIPSTPTLQRDGGLKKQPGLLAQTIVEEEDSDF
ncbi:hypothetical protein CC78DRAFT_580966 [Lojkania enalia]|uniref:Uncharacterized protein n=1 Tax=Lojkania enalia TaxID=147567 RepID=A0A9P4N3R5_9PLEO|nr:hypothetical protein CC78DRAFT_580966 [Didymosphaeria enalia]